ncbi:MAG: DUF4031 domain-containing protein [Actinomycetaceae bacterium]
MAILVDDPLWPAHGTVWSHLVSDHSLEELHAFAAAHELPARSFDLDHYDVPAAALPRLEAGGAQRVDRRELLARLTVAGLRVPQARRADERETRRALGLRGRWADLGARLVHGTDPAPGWRSAWASVGDDLLARWQEPHRSYHDLRHLEGILLDLDTLAEDGAQVTDAVELAAWWHDAVHDGRTPEDERASAELATTALSAPEVAAHLPAGIPDEVARLVLTTADHRATDPAAAALCDADLAILAAPSVRYAAYAKDVRAEYPAVTEADFAVGRARVLRSIAGAGQIFATPQGRARWEGRARENIAAEIAGLEDRGTSPVEQG